MVLSFPSAAAPGSVTLARRQDEGEKFSLPAASSNPGSVAAPTMLAQVGGSLPMPPAINLAPAAHWAAQFVSAALSPKAPVLGVVGVIGAAMTSFGEFAIGRLFGRIPPNVSQREIQMASVAMSDLGLSAEDLSYLKPEQKAFFVKAAAAAVETQRHGSGFLPQHKAGLRMVLEKASQLSPEEIARITPEKARELFGAQPQEEPSGFEMRSSFPRSEFPPKGQVLVNPNSQDLGAPRHTGSDPKIGTSDLSPNFMASEQAGGARSIRTVSGDPRAVQEALAALGEFADGLRASGAGSAKNVDQLNAVEDLLSTLEPDGVNSIIAKGSDGKILGIGTFSEVETPVGVAVELQMMLGIDNTRGSVGRVILQEAWDRAVELNPENPMLAGQVLSSPETGAPNEKLVDYYQRAGATFSDSHTFMFRQRPN